MPQSMPRGMRLGVISPKDAIAAFEARNLLLPSFRWQDVWQEEHQRAFAVAGVSREDVLAVFRDQLDAKFAEGGTLAEFAKAIKPALAAKGFWGDVEVTDPATGETRITRFDAARLQLIYDTNVRQSYAAGKWERYQQTKEQFPFVQYVTMDDGRVRPEHRAWHNLVLPIDDAFWQTHWPPNGWRCRCHAVQLNQRGIDRLQAAGMKLKRTAPADDWRPYVNPYSGEVKAVPRGIDPGFGYNPGVRNQNRDAALAETVLQKALRSSAFSGAVLAAQAAADMPSLALRRAEKFALWVDDVLQAGQPSGMRFSVGTIRPEVVRALESGGFSLESSVVSVEDRDVAHALRPGAGRRGKRSPIALELYKQLPTLINRPVAVLRVLEPRNSMALVYVVDVTDASGRVLKLFIELDQSVKEVVDAQRVNKTVNVVRTASLQMPQKLQDAKAFEVVWGSWP